ncbi:MAG TPA: thioredoxin family protein [Bacteroidota bacterium]|nr:thioredoxin family protein [Bacteroidota bacterium]
MSRYSFLTAVIVFTAVLAAEGCSSPPKVAVRPNEHMEIGWTPRAIFQSPSYAVWFDSGYQHYIPSEEIIHALRTMQDSVGIVVVYGTWCSDSRRELPHLLKVLDASAFPAERLTLIAVDRTMQIPAGIKERYAITNVPTIMIVYRGVEVSRIVESPATTLEGDMRDALGPIFGGK